MDSVVKLHVSAAEGRSSFIVEPDQTATVYFVVGSSGRGSSM